MTRTFLTTPILLLITSQAYASDVCQWQSGQAYHEGAQILNIDKKSDACSKYTSQLPHQLCYGYALCDMMKMAGIKKRSGTFKKRDDKKLQAALDESKYPPSMNSNGVSVAICETSSDGTCPTADECVFKKTKNGNPNKIDVGDEYSDLFDPADHLKKMKVDSVSENGVDNIYYKVDSMDGVQAVAPQDPTYIKTTDEKGKPVQLANMQGVVAITYEKGRRIKDEKYGLLKDATWEGKGEHSAVCLEQFSSSIADCEKKMCVTFADPKETVANTVPYPKYSSPDVEPVNDVIKAK